MSSRRSIFLLLCLAAALAVAGCGATHHRAARPVSLSIESPIDGALVHESSVDLAGSVRPAGATVMVSGHRAAVHGGRFVAHVPLEPGANVIDVMAGGRRTTPALTAIRVTRQDVVRVPDVTGKSPESAGSELRSAGLVPVVKVKSGPFEELLPVDRTVCSMAPGAGAQVLPHSTVRVTVGKIC